MFRFGDDGRRNGDFQRGKTRLKIAHHFRKLCSLTPTALAAAANV